MKSLRSINQILNKNLDTLRESYTNKLLGELEPLPKNSPADDTASTKSKDYMSLTKQTDDLLKVI